MAMPTIMTGVRIAFDFGTDCIHCINDPPEAEFRPSEWEIDDVIIAAFPSGG